MPRPLPLALLALAAALPIACGRFSTTGAAKIPRPPSEERGEFQVVQHGQTIVVERFDRTADSLRGALMIGPDVKVSYRLDLAPDASVTRAVVRGLDTNSTHVRTPDSLKVRILGDSAVVTEVYGDSVAGRRVATRAGAVYYINPSFAMIEQAVRRARAMGGDSVVVPVLLGDAEAHTVPATVRFLDVPARDSALLTLGGVEVELRIGPQGEVLGANVPSQELEVQRTDLPPLLQQRPEEGP